MTALSNAQQEVCFLVINEKTCIYFAFKQKKKQDNQLESVKKPFQMLNKLTVYCLKGCKRHL